MLDCAAIGSELRTFDACESTESGTRVSTHCLYPSFDPVSVFVVERGGEFVVHDDGGAARISWAHGVGHAAVTKSLDASARAFGCEVADSHIRVTAMAREWLWAAIASVANASADAARAAVGRSRASKEESLIARTKAVLDRAVWKPDTKLGFPYHGNSGKLYTFDLSIQYDGSLALIDAVVQHQNSIAAKYLAFSDTETRPGLYKYALHEGELSQEDRALLANVADLVSFQSIERTNGRNLIQ